MNDTIKKTENTKNNSLITPQEGEKPKNALVHGVYASDITLPWESTGDLERLHQELRAEWAPEGRSEEESILGLAHLYQLKHRSMRSAQMARRNDPIVAEVIKAGVKSSADLDVFLQKKADTDDGIMAEATKALKALRDAADKASSMMTASDRDSHKVYEQVEFIRSLFQKHILPTYGAAFEKANGKDTASGNGAAKTIPPKNVIDELCYPENTEKIMRVDAAIGARIDKEFSRLVNIKEFKRLNKALAPKQIEN